LGTPVFRPVSAQSAANSNRLNRSVAVMHDPCDPLNHVLDMGSPTWLW